MSGGTVLCCFPFFREPGSGQLTGGLVSNFHLVRALATLADVRVLSLDARPPSTETARAHGYDVLSHPPPGWKRGAAYLQWRPFLRQAFSRAVGRWGTPDLLIATTSTVPLLEADTKADHKRIAIVRAYENFGWRVPQGTMSERWQGIRLEAVRGFSSRRLLRDTDMVLASSRYLAGQVKALSGASRVEVLYPCIDIGLAADPQPTDDDRALRVGFVSGTASKNLDFVIDLARAMPDVEFHVFGTGDLPHASSNLVARGWESDRDRMYRSAPVWIVPSRWHEPFGRVASEARAMGRIAIVSNRGGLPEAAGPDAPVIDTFEPHAWIRAIREALQEAWNPQGRRQRIAQALATFGQAAHDERVASLFGPLLTRRR